MGLLQSIGKEYWNYDPLNLSNTLGTFLGSGTDDLDQRVLTAYRKAGYSQQDAQALTQQFYNKQNPVASMPQAPSMAPMATGQANAYVNPQAVKQLAQGINQGTQGTQPQGEWWQQLGGYFQDRPAFTQGLMTTGIGLLAGLPASNAFAVGGQAYTGKQNAISGVQKQQYDRAMEAQKFELETIKANAEILKAINEGGVGATSYKAALDEAVKSGLVGEEAQRYAMFRQAGITPPIKNKKAFGLFGKQYTVVNK